MNLATDLIKEELPALFGPIPLSELHTPMGKIALTQADVLLLSSLSPKTAHEISPLLESFKGEIHLVTKSKAEFALLRSMGAEGFRTAAIYSQESVSVKELLALKSANFWIKKVPLQFKGC